MSRMLIARDERAANLPKYYFTGNPCSNGHVTVRYSKTHQCLQCSRNATREYLRTHSQKEYMHDYDRLEHVKEHRRARQRAAWPDRWKRERNWWLKSKFGLPIGQYDRMLEQQGGVCAICGEKRGKRHLAVDHCHTSGKIRGLLCGPCNGALGLLRDDTSLLRKAIKYLQQHKEGNNGERN